MPSGPFLVSGTRTSLELSRTPCNARMAAVYFLSLRYASASTRAFAAAGSVAKEIGGPLSTGGSSHSLGRAGAGPRTRATRAKRLRSSQPRRAVAFVQNVRAQRNRNDRLDSEDEHIRPSHIGALHPERLKQRAGHEQRDEDRCRCRARRSIGALHEQPPAGVCERRRVAGMRINYGCPGGWNIVGDIDRSQPVWRVFAQTENASALEQVEIAVAWY